MQIESSAGISQQGGNVTCCAPGRLPKYSWTDGFEAGGRIEGDGCKAAAGKMGRAWEALSVCACSLGSGFWEELGKGSRGRYGVRQAVADESREQCEEGEGVGAQKST